FSFSLPAQGVERFSLVARLGVDTIAVETVERSADAVRSEVVIRSPRTTLLRHNLSLDANGLPARLITEQLDLATGAVTATQEWHWHGDSVTIPSGRTIAAPATALPCIDLVHWPFDHLLRGLKAS